MLKPIRHSAKSLRAAERGAALVAVLGAMLAVVTFAVAVTASVTSNFGQSNRDRNVKRALAAAEAGIQEATYRLNMLQPTSFNPCVTVAGGIYVSTPIPPGAGAWCNAETISLGNGITAAYQISPYIKDNGVIFRSIVSTGTVNGVSRRILAPSAANTGAPLFGGYAVQSDRLLSLSNHSDVTGSVRSNDNISLNNNARILCGTTPGNATPGPGRLVLLGDHSSVCGSRNAARDRFPLTPVDQGDAPTNNSNGRLAPGGADTRSRNGVTWTESTRTLTLSNAANLTLGGPVYSLCKLVLENNSELNIAAGVKVQIYFDSTANCGPLPDNAEQLKMESHAKIRNNNHNPTYLQIYMMGGTPQMNNEAELGNNSLVTELVFYGPYTKLELENNASIVGAVVAGKVSLENHAQVMYSASTTDITIGTIGVYQRLHYVECTPTTSGNMPDSEC